MPEAADGGYDADEGLVGEGPESDEEMPLADHIEEMVYRLGIVLVVMAVVSGIFFPFGDRIINFLWYSVLPGGDIARPRVYHPLGLILARLKVATLGGFVIGLPVFVYQTYLFMRPGLYRQERRYYLASVPASLVLAAVGVLFAYLLILPAIFTYFLSYSQQSVDRIAFGLSQTFDLIVMMMGLFAAVFQIPLFIMLAIMMGVTTRAWLVDKRLYFWGAFLGVAFLFSPDPTGMAPIMVAATMIGLFEATLGVLGWTGEGSIAPGPREVAGLRPLVWLLVGVASYLASPAPVPSGYYDALPAVVTGSLEAVGATGLAPILVGVGLAALYELFVRLLRRFDAPIRLRAAVTRLRVPAWLVAAGAGYLVDPDASLLARVDVSLLGPWEAAALVALLLAAYEGGLVVWRYRRG